MLMRVFVLISRDSDTRQFHCRHGLYLYDIAAGTTTFNLTMIISGTGHVSYLIFNEFNMSFNTILRDLCNCKDNSM